MRLSYLVKIQPVRLLKIQPARTKQEPLRVRGSIAWQRKNGENYQCGVEFQDLDGAKVELMKKCFEFYNKNAEFV